MSSTAASGALVVLLLTVPAGHCGVTYSSTHICGFRGSCGTVDIPCSYTYPSKINGRDTTVTEKLWLVKFGDNEAVDLRTDPQYSNRVQYLYSENDCSLRIRDLRVTDSAEYKFRFITNQEGGSYTGSPGVTLSVTEPQLQIHVRKSTVGQFPPWTELTCHSSCQPPDPYSYIWYKNGVRVEREEKKYFYLLTSGSADRYHCAIDGHESNPSPPVYAPTSVSVSPSGGRVDGSSVTLTCSSDANPAANYTWYKKDTNPARLQVSKEPQLVFSPIQASDSGEYFCTAENELGKRTSGIIDIDVKWISVMIINIIRWTLLVLMLVALLTLSLWMTKKKTPHGSNSEANQDCVEMTPRPLHQDLSDVETVAAAQTSI